MEGPKIDALIPVLPPPKREGVVAVPPIAGAGFVVFPKILPPLPDGVGTGVDGFAPNKLPGVAEVEPPPNRLPPVAGAVVVVPGAGIVEVAPKIEPAGLELKMFAEDVVVVPVPVVSVPVVPVPVAGVVVDVLLV